MEKATTKRKKLSGTVVSDSGDKTITVLVSRFVKHPKYGKYMQKSKKYRVHDEENRHKNGDTVTIEECRPISKNKHFRVLSESAE